MPTKVTDPGFTIHEDRLEPAAIALPALEPSNDAQVSRRSSRISSGESQATISDSISCSKKRKRSAMEKTAPTTEISRESSTEKENHAGDDKRACIGDDIVPLTWEKRTQKPKDSNPNECIDILDQLYDRWYIQEKEFTASPYLDKQVDINAKMRAILVDWLVEVHYKFKLHSSTLWLTINILDRYLEKEQTVRAELQLVGVTSLFIACKFEEIYPPEVRDCVYITDHAYPREKVLEMEHKILKTLNYQICVPTGYHFMVRYLNYINASCHLRNLSFYYAERNLQEYDMLNCLPHKFAAGALYAALHQVQMGHPQPRTTPTRNVWTIELTELTGFTEGDLLVCASGILKHVQEETITASKRQLIATKKKYSVEKYFNISALPVPRLGLSTMDYF